MNKRLGLTLTVIGSFLLSLTTHAQVNANDLMGLGMPAPLASLIASNIGGNSENNPVTFNFDGDPNRIMTFGASADDAYSIRFGDYGVTTRPFLNIGLNTLEGDDDGFIIISGGGNGLSRGGTIVLYGNQDFSNPGKLKLDAGMVAGGTVEIITGQSGTPYRRWYAEYNSGGFGNDASHGGDLYFRAPGTTVAIQEGTAANACSGTLTANGATPVVVATTCATTGSRIFLTRTSAETGVVSAWRSALTNGVSFAITGEAGDTGTYDWFIIHEAP